MCNFLFSKFVVRSLCVTERQWQRHDLWCHRSPPGAREENKECSEYKTFRFSILTLKKFESELFSHFVHVILLNDVIKQRVKIVEEGDNLQEMTK